MQYAQYRDIESQEELLVPGMSKTDNMLRWGFIRKVHPIHLQPDLKHLWDGAMQEQTTARPGPLQLQSITV